MKKINFIGIICILLIFTLVTIPIIEKKEKEVPKYTQLINDYELEYNYMLDSIDNLHRYIRLTNIKYNNEYNKLLTNNIELQQYIDKDMNNSILKDRIHVLHSIIRSKDSIFSYYNNREVILVNIQYKKYNELIYKTFLIPNKKYTILIRYLGIYRDLLYNDMRSINYKEYGSSTRKRIIIKEFIQWIENNNLLKGNYNIGSLSQNDCRGLYNIVIVYNLPYLNIE